LWREELDKLNIKYRQVNWVHDEWVTEVVGDRTIAERVGQIQSDAIRAVGEIFKLRCPMGGESKIGKNWLEVH
jgi:DNA polymerase-1